MWYFLFTVTWTNHSNFPFHTSSAVPLKQKHMAWDAGKAGNCSLHVLRVLRVLLAHLLVLPCVVSDVKTPVAVDTLVWLQSLVLVHVAIVVTVLHEAPATDLTGIAIVTSVLPHMVNETRLTVKSTAAVLTHPFLETVIERSLSFCWHHLSLLDFWTRW